MRIAESGHEEALGRMQMHKLVAVVRAAQLQRAKVGTFHGPFLGPFHSVVHHPFHSAFNRLVHPCPLLPTTLPTAPLTVSSTAASTA